MVKNIIGELIEIDWLTDLHELQPDNAKRPYNYGHLKESIIKYGFAVPFAVWNNKGKYYAIDGHTRKLILTELQGEGVEVPKMLKAFEIKAKNRKEAVEILIAVFNQRHNPFDGEVLTEWLEVEEIEVEEINMDSLNVEWVTDDAETHLEAIEDDFDTTPPEIPITVFGDLFEIGEHRLLCGDSTQTDTFEKLMRRYGSYRSSL